MTLRSTHGPLSGVICYETPLKVGEGCDANTEPSSRGHPATAGVCREQTGGSPLQGDEGVLHATGKRTCGFVPMGLGQ